MATLDVGQTIDRYRIDAPLGRGGMGEVYRAFDARLRRSVALKVVRADDELLPGGGMTEALRSKLLREARAAAALKHTNIVTIFDVGDFDGTPYIAMELVEGTSLRAYVHAENVSLDRKLRWIFEIASALAAAHRAGLVHRDVKPDNVMVALDDAIKVLDFGIAKLDDAGPASIEAPASARPSERTGAGAVLGTPRYMSPEQSEGRPIDARSDQFSWAVVAYELLAGAHPRDTTPGFSARAGWSDAAAPIGGSCADLPSEVEEVILRALEREPLARFATMDEVCAKLAPFLPTTARVLTAHPPAVATIDRDAATRASPPTLGAPRDEPHAVADPTGADRAQRPSSRAAWIFGAAFVVGSIAALVVVERGAQTSAIAPSSSSAHALVEDAPTRSAPLPVLATAVSTETAATASVGSSAGARTAASGPRAATGAPKPWSISHVTHLLPGMTGGYAKPTIEAALAPKLAALEACLKARGASADDAVGSINIAFNGETSPSMSVACRGAVGCGCYEKEIGYALDIGPSPEGKMGTISVSIDARSP